MIQKIKIKKWQFWIARGSASLFCTNAKWTKNGVFMAASWTRFAFSNLTFLQLICRSQGSLHLCFQRWKWIATFDKWIHISAFTVNTDDNKRFKNLDLHTLVGSVFSPGALLCDWLFMLTQLAHIRNSQSFRNCFCIIFIYIHYMCSTNKL